MGPCGVYACALTALGALTVVGIDNGSHKSTLYADDTVLQTFTISSTVVSIPCPGMPATACGTPTGVVWNPIQASLTSFLVSGTPAKFIWATEDGTIVGWNTGTFGIIEKDNSGVGAVYKGLEVATNSGTTLLYVTNFNAGTVEMYDTSWTQVGTPGAFTDPKLPPGYAPFNIVLVGNRLIVTYAVRDPVTNDDVKGAGLGTVNSFDLTGHGLKSETVISMASMRRPARSSARCTMASLRQDSKESPLSSMACGPSKSAMTITGKVVTPTRCISPLARMTKQTVCSVRSGRTVYTAHHLIHSPGRNARGRGLQASTRVCRSRSDLKRVPHKEPSWPGSCPGHPDCGAPRFASRSPGQARR